VLKRLRHRVECVRQLVDLGGACLREPRREVPGSDAAGAACDVADRPRDPAREERAEEEQQASGCGERGDAEPNRLPRLALRGGGALGGERVLARLQP
jgi:hypothetical protein